MFLHEGIARNYEVPPEPYCGR